MASDNYLKNIHSPADIKGMSYAQLNELAAEIRTVLIDTVSKNGGHLASNLGVVELTLAMHKEFDSPRDKFVWDVGHQAYTHKLLTGRREGFARLRMLDGLVDIYLPDLKYFSVYYAERYSAASDYFDVACEAVDEMLRQVGTPQFDADGMMTHGVILRHLMLPTLAQDTAQILRAVSKRWGSRVLVSLMRQYTPLPHVQAFPELCRRITQEEYDNACELMAELGLDGFVQEAESVGESFIPVFDGSGIAAPSSNTVEVCL